VRLYPRGRAECAKRHAHVDAYRGEPCTRPGRWQSSVSTPLLTSTYSLNTTRPEQLVLQDDPSFLPDFALPPPELLADLDFGLDLNISRSDDSQSLTPFGSQRSQSSSHTDALGVLVLPTSSPGGFELQGDNNEAGLGGFLGATDGLDLGDPDFMFDENGEYLEVPVAQNVAGTPAARSAAAMHSDAGASAKVRKEHEEGRMGGAQVSFTAIRLLFRLRSHSSVFSRGLLGLTCCLIMAAHDASLGSR
jgi:hypothetical protein